MASTSVLPAVKARLVELLADAAELTDVDVSWGFPKDPKREVVYFGKTTGTVSPAGMVSARRHRNEDLDLLLVIDTAVPGSTPEAAERRAFELYAVVEDLIANDPALHPGLPQRTEGGVDGVLSAQITTFTAGPDPEIEGYSGLLVATIAVSARLT
jgi:hypothetical protein